MTATHDLQRVRYVTENYQQLQGLRMVPFGVALLLATPIYAGWQLTQAGILLVLWLLPVAVGCALWWLVGRYYTRTFGYVQPLPRPRPTWPEQVIVWVLILGAVIVPQRMAHTLSLSLALMTLALLAVILFALRRSGHPRLRLHWLVLPTVLAAVNLALLFPIPLLRPDQWSTYTLFAIWVGSIGLGMIAGGLLDHRLLLRTLGSPVQDSHVQTI